MASSSSNSAPKSESSAARSPATQEDQDVSSVVTVEEGIKENAPKNSILEMETQEQIEKLKKYQAEFESYLMAKYFSDKTIFGGNIFDVKMNIDGQPIKASRFPGSHSYADPAKFQEEVTSDSSAASETPTNTSNGKQPAKKN